MQYKMGGNDNVQNNEDRTNYKAITCDQIPELFLDKIVAKNHFGKYGKIKRFILRPTRLSCTIEYENDEDAKKAYLNAGSFNGIDFVVRYAEQEVAHVQNTEEWVDPEVQAELEAMSPSFRFEAKSRHLISHKPNTISRVTRSSNSSVLSPKTVKIVTRNKQNSPLPDISKFDCIRQEIEALLKTPAFTDEEKYRILDARDKLIRLSTVRQTDIKKAMATKGTCPDMCPEKERLMREFQRQVSVFEMDDDEGSESTISHKKAIKEYSRSSADQEVPLSHELRSETVLEMTMLYLVHRIMGLCDDPKTSLCDWFHFVWDRTRSIRKDITQQELCSLPAVKLVEQCARFHIHCAARLVAEDPSVFDKKINAENLTKCLQTLKYMYHDLRIKGICCPCEAEFRSYVILLNLGDSNFLWEVRQLPEFIQKSAEIKRAVEFYNVLQNNNYVRFFSMIKSSETSYLSSCILLGYFTKLRIRAMDAIIKSHNWRKNDVYLPLSYLVDILGFDNESSAVTFFNHYGLHCDTLENRVLLDRLIKPNSEYVMDRAVNLVESKRNVSVGECVFGKMLPSPFLFEHHQPHNSFDINGMLKTDSLLISNHLMESDKRPKVPHKLYQDQRNINLAMNDEINLFKKPKNLSIIPPIQQEEPKIVQDVKGKPHNVFTVKENDQYSEGLQFCDSIFKESAGALSMNLSVLKPPLANKQPDKIINIPSMKVDHIFDTNSNSLQPKRNDNFSITVMENSNIVNEKLNVFNEFRTRTELLDSEPKIKENKIIRKKIDDESDLNKSVKQLEKKEIVNSFNENRNSLEYGEVTIDELDTILEKYSEKTAEQFLFRLIEDEVLKLARSELFDWQTIAEASNMQNELLISEVIKFNVQDIANEEYAIMCYDQLLLSRYFGRWQMYLRKRKERKKFIENTPLWMTADTRAQYAHSIKHPSQHQNMEMIKRYRFGQSCNLKDIFKTEYGQHESPLNLFALVGQHLLSTQNFTSCGLLQQRKYLKFLITIPENTEELPGFGNILNKWLLRGIQKCQSAGGPFVHGVEHNVALCVRKLNGITPKNENGIKMTTEGDHNDGILCFISGIQIETQSRKRLYSLLKSTRNLKRVPLAVIVYNCNCKAETLAELLDLDFLQEEGFIHSYVILGCQMERKELNFRELFIKAVDFITIESSLLNSNEIQALAMQNILPFLETSVGEEMWQKWCSSTKKNPIFNKIFCTPDHVVGIFHKALDHLLHITQEDFEDMPEFPEELKIFVSENISLNVPLGLEFFPTNWKGDTEKKVIRNFLKTLYLPKINEKVPTDIEELKLWLLQYSSQCIQDDDLVATKALHEAITNLVSQINHLTSQNRNLSSSMSMINYLTVLKPIIFARINRMLKEYKKSLLNLKVIYLKDDLKNYQTQPWWLNYEPLNFITIDYSEIQSNYHQTLQNEENQGRISPNDISKIISKGEEASRKGEESISEFKRRNRIIYGKFSTNFSLTSHLKRTLEDSLYQFELSKKVGRYDTSFVAHLTNEIDNSISKVMNQSFPSTQKRKIYSVPPLEQCSDIDKIISKANKLIQNVESKKEQKIKTRIRTENLK